MIVIEKKKKETPVKVSIVKKAVAIKNKRKQPTIFTKLDKDKLWRMKIRGEK